jgi:DNA-binding MarR family transcriptional regulator
MQDEYVLLSLRMIKYGLSSKELILRGLDYSQVTRIISWLLEEGLIKDPDNEKRFVLTSQGRMRLENLEKKFFPRLEKNWLHPKDSARIPQKDLFDVYLPEDSD